VRPVWLARIATALCVFGLGVASYLTYEHYTGSKTLSCPAHSSIVNCFKVTTSSYSKIQGIPVAVLGLIFFVVMLGLQLPRSWASNSPLLTWGRLGWSIVGVGTACWLIYAELFKLDAICLWCTSVHIISLLVFIVTAFGTAMVTTAFDYEADASDPPA